MSVGSRSPGIGEVLENARENTAADVRSCCVARVVRWSVSKAREADVQPVHKRAYTAEDGTRTPDKQPVIPSVPVVYPGGGGLVITWPLQVGDEVLLVFSDDSLDRYLQVGGQGDIDPADDRHHHLTDAICIPGIRSLATPTSVVATAVSIGTNGGSFEGAALGATLKTFLDNVKTYLDAHTHDVTVTGTCDPVALTCAATGTAAAPSASPTVPTVESSTVKVTP